MIVLVPFQSLGNAEESNQVAGAIESDLRLLRETLQIRCPSWLLTTDLETVPGFDVLIQGLDADRRQRLFGGELPLYPDLPPADVPGLIAPAIDSFLGATSSLLMRVYLVDSPEVSAAEVTLRNGRLFEFLQTLRAARDGLVGVLTRFVQQESGIGAYLGGFYFAGTGHDPP